MQSGKVHVSGFLAWLSSAGIHLQFLTQSNLRVSVFLQWVWTYVTGQRKSWLIVNRYGRDRVKPASEAELDLQVSEDFTTTKTALQRTALALPKRDLDFCQMTSTLSDTEQTLLKRITRLHGKPGRVDYQQILGGGLFPFEIVSAIRDLKIASAGYEGYGCAACTTLHSGKVLC